MFFVRWIPTFLAFPAAGLIAMLVVGPTRNPLTALAVGAIVGGIVGLAQWLALGRLTDWRWAAGTFVAVPLGSVLSMLVVGAPVTLVAALLTGLITGAVLGAVQGVVLRRALRATPGVILIWTATVALSWAAAWTITALVIVDIDRAHAVFGASGALLATIVTGIVLRLLLGERATRASRTAPPAGELAGTGKRGA